MNILVTSIVDLERIPFNRIHVFLNHLSQNHQIAALCLNAWWLEDGHRDPYFHRVFDKVQIAHLATKKAPPILQETLSIHKLRRMLKNGADFDLHINYASLISGLFVTRSLRARGIPTVFDISDDLPAAFMVSPRVPGTLRWLAGFISETLLKANARLAKRVTFITKALQSKYALPSAKSTLLPNGFDTDLFKAHPTQEARTTLGIDPNAFVLGFVGTMGKEWVDFEPVYAAVKRLAGHIPNLKLLVVGNGEGLVRNRNLAAQHKITDRVIFTGYVPHRQVPGFISCADVCLVPFRDLTLPGNASPIKLFEYMACQRPVISTPSAGVIETVGDRVLYATDQEAWEQKITELYQDPKLRATMGTEGREFVASNYGWPKICQQFETVLLEAV
jgi:glycosyltransferase involved in cell wall biosynthesis